MSTTTRWQLVPEGVYAGSALLPERKHLHHWLAACAVAGVTMLSLVVSPSRVVAGEARSTLTSPGGSETPQLPEVGPGGAKPGYVPRIIGSWRNRLLHGGAGLKHSPQGTVDCPLCDPLGVFDSSFFHRPTRVNNKWYSMKPGTQMVYQGVANRGGGLLPHVVIFTVTDLVKRINGINCVVAWDQDIGSGVLQESELFFIAQSDSGDAWLAGEYPEEYENGQFIGAENTWIHGIEAASAGVPVQKNPILGTPGFLQAIALENDFWDCGQVHSISLAKRRHRFDHDGDKDRGRHKGWQTPPDTLVIREWAPLDGCSVIQIKTYVAGIGVVAVGALDDPEGETLALIQVSHLSSAAMDSARTSALILDAHGYQVNEIYAQTDSARLAPRHGHRHGDGDAGDDDDGDDDGDDLVAGQAFGAASVASSRTFMSVGPNPVTTSAGVAYGIAQAGPVELGIFDVVGRRIRTLVNEVVAPGIHRVQWDGRDDAGNGVARGVYFARLRTGTEVVRKTLMVVR